MAFALIILTVHASTSEGTLMVAPPPQSVEINHARLYEQIELLSPTSIRTVACPSFVPPFFIFLLANDTPALPALKGIKGTLPLT